MSDAAKVEMDFGMSFKNDSVSGFESVPCPTLAFSASEDYRRYRRKWSFVLGSDLGRGILFEALSFGSGLHFLHPLPLLPKMLSSSKLFVEEEKVS